MVFGARTIKLRKFDGVEFLRDRYDGFVSCCHVVNIKIKTCVPTAKTMATPNVIGSSGLSNWRRGRFLPRTEAIKKDQKITFLMKTYTVGCSFALECHSNYRTDGHALADMTRHVNEAPRSASSHSQKRSHCQFWLLSLTSCQVAYSISAVRELATHTSPYLHPYFGKVPPTFSPPAYLFTSRRACRACILQSIQLRHLPPQPPSPLPAQRPALYAYCTAPIHPPVRSFGILITMSCTPAFTSLPVAAKFAPQQQTPKTSPLHAPRQVVAEGRKRARALMYGAGGAFRGLASRRTRLAEMVRLRAGGFGGGFGGKGFGSGGGPWWSHDDDEGNVDPSWGAAPGVHVVMRGKSDEAYRAAVANIVAMGSALASASAPGFVVDPSVPVVVILSWMGAQKKHLSKYKTFYESKGYEVHCVLNDLKTAMFPPASRAQAQRIADFIAGQPADRPVLIHAFSIGTGIYGLLLDSLRHEKEQLDQFRKKVVGVVFDSGPAPIFPNDVAKGLNTVFPVVSKAIWEPIVTAFFSVTRARKWYGQSEDALRKFQFPAPQLYFFSGDDQVIPNIQTAVEEFIEKNKQHGVEVYKKFWEKSVHASHLKIHPEEYLHNLSNFVNRCMEVRKEKLALPAPVVAQ